MRRTEALQGVRMAVFLNVLGPLAIGGADQEEAAEFLGVSERTFRRRTPRYEEEGEAGLMDRRLGKTSGKRVPVDRAEEAERLYRERYQGFTSTLPRIWWRTTALAGATTRPASSSADGGVFKRRARGRIGASPEGAAAGHQDPASGRLAPCLAGRPGGARPDPRIKSGDDDGRRDGASEALLTEEEGTA